MRERFNAWVLLAALMLWFTGCSAGGGEDMPAQLELTLEKEVVSSFEPVTCAINVRTMEDMKRSYDSVIWYTHSAGMNIGMVLPLHNAARGENLVWKIDASNYTKGKHEVTVKGYKGGRIISEQSKSFTVVDPGGDFFNFRWSGANTKETLFCTQGLLPLRYKGVYLELSYDPGSGEGEYAKLRYMPWQSRVNNYPQGDLWTDGELEAVTAEYYDVLRGLMNGMYGQSISRYEGTDVRSTHLSGEYDSKFNYALNNSLAPGEGEFPVEIWEDDATVVCHIAVYGGKSFIIAEPRK